MSASSAFALPLSASALRPDSVTRVWSKTLSCALKVLAVVKDSEAIIRYVSISSRRRIIRPWR
ncbi:hypothetical protein D3C84_1142040 [compost metagenome]